MQIDDSNKRLAVLHRDERIVLEDGVNGDTDALILYALDDGMDYFVAAVCNSSDERRRLYRQGRRVLLFVSVAFSSSFSSLFPFSSYCW